MKAAEVNTVVYLEHVSYGPVVLGEENKFVGRHHLNTSGGIDFESVGHLNLVEIVDLSGHDLRGEPVASVISAKFDVVVRVGSIGEVGTYGEVLDAGVILTSDVGFLVVRAGTSLFDVAQERICISCIGASNVHENLWSQFVVPSQRSEDVAPSVFRAHVLVFAQACVGADINIYFILSYVETGEEAAAVRELVSDFGICIVEPVAGLEVRDIVGGGGEGFDKRNHEDVSIGATGRYVEGGAFLDDRAFETEFGRYQTEREVAVKLLVVAIVGRYVEDAGEPSAEASRETALIEGDVLYGIGVEGREKTAHVVDIV